MPIKVLKLHHHGIRIDPSEQAVEQARAFYSGLLGIPADENRPGISDLPGLWLNVGSGDSLAQLHLMGATGRWSQAKSEHGDPTRPHVALAVEDIEQTEQELLAQGIQYARLRGAAGKDSDQIFLNDPFGNVIELRQIGS